MDYARKPDIASPDAVPTSMPVATLLDVTRLPALAPALARMQRLSLDERLSALLAHSFGVKGWTVGLRYPFETRRAMLVTLRWGLREACFALDADQHLALSSLIAGDAAIQPALRTAVCALLLEPLVTAFTSLGMDGVEIAAFELAATTPANEPCCSLAFQLGARTIDAVLVHIDAEWLQALERLVAQQCLPFAAHVSGIAVPGRLLIGERNISMAALDSLRTGDVILRAVPPPLAALYRGDADSARLQVVWGRYGTRQLRAPARISAHSLTLEEDPVMNHEIQSNVPLTDSIDAPVDISQLDLPLKLEIDTISLPVAQLSALRTGYVLELPTPLSTARIRLVTYGQTVGFGELVSVGDHLGVRVVQLPQSCDHGSV
jgi:type III secretion protein Q